MGIVSLSFTLAWGKEELVQHLLLDLRGCNKQVLDNLETLKGIFYSVIEDAKVVERFHQFYPQGVSGIVRTNNMCLSIHTWPEHCYAAIDILCYSSDTPVEEVAQSIIRKLETTRPLIRVLSREI